ncbi:TRAP transporter small permease [Nocardioides sambongensis]|uniref:TRAP transporter small permease n=1 Tax=Nocardioides sambongensis TaxID=2589074 RepID=UPI001128E82D|nr:TRAP transporter small permease [Nocardioides sambongensis]
MNAVKKGLRAIDTVFEIVTLTCLLGVVFVVLYQIFGREVLDSTPAWSEELSRILLIWIGMLCAALGFREGAHIAITFVVDRFPKLLRRAVDYGVLALVLLFGLYLLVDGIQLTDEASVATLPGTGLPRSALYAALPFSGAMICLYTVQQFFGIDTRRYARDVDAADYE